MPQIKTTEYLKYTFTRAEREKHAQELAQKCQHLAELDLRQKSLAASIAADKKAANEAISQLTGWISHGYDYRDISCVVKLDYPVVGQKTIYREDTYESVKTIAMRPDEKQEPLPFDGVPCSTCMPRYFNGNVLVDGPWSDCAICGGTGKQPEEATPAEAQAATAGVNGAPADNGVPEDKAMGAKKAESSRSHKCRHQFCPNRYSDVIGGDGAFGARKSGAVCIPCLYAEQMIDHGQTIEQVEAVPHLMSMFIGLLGKTGWTWQDVKDSYQRMKAAGAGR